MAPANGTHVCVLSCFSRVWLSETSWTVTRQAHPSMGFSRQEYWSELPCPPPGDLPDPGIECLLRFLHWQEGLLPIAPPGNSLMDPSAEVRIMHMDNQQHLPLTKGVPLVPILGKQSHISNIPIFLVHWLPSAQSFIPAEFTIDPMSSESLRELSSLITAWSF